MEAAVNWLLAPCYWAVGQAKRSIAKEFTRTNINYQKELAVKIASQFKNYVYVFDETNFFTCANSRCCDNIVYLVKDDKFEVLSRTAQVIMKNSNEYLQFNTNKDNVEKDDIGVRYLLTAVFEEKIKDYRRLLFSFLLFCLFSQGFFFLSFWSKFGCVFCILQIRLLSNS